MTATTPTTAGVAIDPPFHVIEVLREWRFPKWDYSARLELVGGIDRRGPKKDFWQVTNYYSLSSGHWIGAKHTRDRRCTATYLTRRVGLAKIQKAEPGHCVASIGFSEERQTWAGWSHRALCEFGIGDRIFNERYHPQGDKTPFKRHGKRLITKLWEAKLAAKRFAASVS